MNSNQHVTRRRTRLQSRLARLAPFPLLKLPLELRNIILCKLLISSNTIETLNFSRLHAGSVLNQGACGLTPAILRVNRQLHMEGQLLLFENSFACYCSYDTDLRIRVDPRGVPKVERLPFWVTNSIRKVVIHIDTTYIRSYSHFELQEQIRRLCHIMKKTSWTDITLHFSRDDTDWARAAPEVLQQLESAWEVRCSQTLIPFSFIRKMDRIQVSGKAPACSQSLVQSMVSTIPSVDLDAQYHLLIDYLDNCSLLSLWGSLRNGIWSRNEQDELSTMRS